MTSVTHAPSASRIGAVIRSSEQPLVSLRLNADADGWSLAAEGGELVFHSPGIAGRRRCLDFARRHGVLTIRT
jgi:hypothetical protein